MGGHFQALLDSVTWEKRSALTVHLTVLRTKRHLT